MPSSLDLSPRTARIADGLKQLSADVLVCTKPNQVLLLTGYWPIVGTSIALLTREHETYLIAPTDEESFASKASADHIESAALGTLERPTSLLQDIRPHLQKALQTLGIASGARVAIDRGPSSEQAPYVAFTLYGASIENAIIDVLPGSSFLDAHELLRDAASVLVESEIEIVRRAAFVASQAYERGVSDIKTGVTEFAASLPIANLLTLRALPNDGSDRAFGHVACVSGKNSGSAYGAYARSTRKTIAAGELVLTHCNSTLAGYWTDVTRTYVVGEPTPRLRTMFEALLKASRAGIATVKPGVKAVDIDKAVRDSLQDDGFGEQFKHGTGHGVGFAAIDHQAKPRLRPNSPDTIEPGMIFNIEPGIYFPDFGGMRHCDMILCTESGAELLTPFHQRIEDLVLVQ